MRQLFDLDSYTTFVSGMPGVHVAEQWDSHVAKVGDKVFALLNLDNPEGVSLTLKIPQDEFEFLSAIPGVRQPPYFAKGQWIRIMQESELPDDEIIERVRDSYGIIATKLTRKARAELGIADDLLVR